MRPETYNPTERTAKRAAQEFADMLRKPKFDNGDNSFTGAMTQVLAARLPHDPQEDKLIQFRDALAQWLMTTNEHGSVNNQIFTDYGPDPRIKAIADAVGLKVQFPWKTSIWVSSDHISVRAGYSAETVYHYALENGKWLVTTLIGSEIQKIKEFALNGTVPTFRVDDEALLVHAGPAEKPQSLAE